MKPIATIWTSHLRDPKKQEDFEKTVRNSTLVLNRLFDILTTMENDVLKSEVTKDQYQSPAWPQLQAHRNGNRETIKKLKDLIGFAI